VFEQGALFQVVDEVTVGDGGDSGVDAPRGEVLGERGRKLTEREVRFARLLRDDGESGAGIAVGRIEEKAAVPDAVLKIADFGFAKKNK